MKKFTLIFLSLALVLSMAACGKAEPAKEPENTAVTATPEEIEAKIAEAVGGDNYLCNTEIEKEWLENSRGLDLSKVESFAAKQNAVSSVCPDTVIVLKVSDGYAEEAVAALNKSYAQTVGYIRQYPFGTAKVLNARLYQSGNYVLYIIAGAPYEGEDAEAENKLAESEYAKIDEAIRSIFGTVPENLAVVPEDNGSAGGLIIPENTDRPLIGG